MTAYLTTYNGLVCENCAHDHRNPTPVSEADLVDVYGYDTARCEECKTTLYDGLAVAS